MFLLFLTDLPFELSFQEIAEIGIVFSQLKPRISLCIELALFSLGLKEVLLLSNLIKELFLVDLELLSLLWVQILFVLFDQVLNHHYLPQGT